MMKLEIREKFLIYFLILITVGSSGFIIIEGREWTIIDGLYMTIITLSTVGFGEVMPLSQMGKLWAILVILFGVTGFMALVSQVSIDIIELTKYRKRKMSKKISKLNNHYIICGFGRAGSVIAEEITEKKKPIVIIENDLKKIDQIQDLNYLYIEGDATLDESLILAGAEKAKGIVITLENDQDNLFVTMAAKNLAPEAYILTRCSKHPVGKMLKRAGADKVVNPYIAGGHKMAELLLAPYVEDTVMLTTPKTTHDIIIDEISMNKLEQYDGIMIKDSKLREKYNLIVVGVIDKDDEFSLNPDPHTVLSIDQTIMLIGSKENLARFKQEMFE